MSTPEPTPVGYVGHAPGVTQQVIEPAEVPAAAPVDMRIEPTSGALGAAPPTATGEVEVAPRLYLGNWHDSQYFDGEILNVRDEEHHARETFHVGMLIPVPPGHPAKFCVSRAKLDEAAEIIEQRLRLGDRRLLVHCLVGMERSPLAIAWWMVKTHKQPNLQAALAQLKSARPIVEDRSNWLEPEPAPIPDPMTLCRRPDCDHTRATHLWFEGKSLKCTSALCGCEEYMAPPADMRIEIPSGGLIPLLVNGELPGETAAAELTAPPSLEGDAAATAPSVLTEQQKYELMWSHEQYRGVAPGESIAPTFLEVAQPKPGSTVIDFGAGTGRGALMIAIMTNGALKVEMLDFAENCLDEDVRNCLVTQAHCLTFRQHDLTQAVPITAQYGYCTDVMEHIPPEQVDQVLFNVMQAAQHVFFQIALTDDVCGKLIGHPLHLSVHPFEWWLKKFQDFDAAVHWSKDCGEHALFYVSAWRDGLDFIKHGTLNVEQEVVKANVLANITVPDRKQVEPYLQQPDVEVLILGGGPSLEGQLEEIRALRDSGAKLVTLNGTYGWAISKGLKPSAQIICDARPFNERFVDPIDIDPKGCRYFLASQVDPALFAKCPPERTYMWHTAAGDVKELLDQHLTKWWDILGGCTVMLRSLPLLRMLGFSKFHLFGADSCLVGPDDQNLQHHSYAQPENDGQRVISVTVGTRVFKCHPWMITQAQGFIALINFMGDMFEIQVHGDGMLAYVLSHAAELNDLEMAANDPLGI